jgi:predicted RNase H-like nuclease (RuvC/YqgF family)
LINLYKESLFVQFNFLIYKIEEEIETLRLENSNLENEIDLLKKEINKMKNFHRSFADQAIEQSYDACPFSLSSFN